MKQLTILIAVGIFFHLSIASISAQSGSLDLTFNGTGKVTTNIGPGDVEGRSVAIQPDGKIVVAGFRWNGTNRDFGVVRYLSDGTLDASFDLDGKLTTDIYGGDDYAQSVALKSDGRIIVSGFTWQGPYSNFATVCYNSDGSLDSTFDSDGIVMSSIVSGSIKGYSTLIQPDGKIIVAGYIVPASTVEFIMIRYNNNGSVDSTFDSDGVVTTPLSWNTQDVGCGAALQSDGKIVLAGNIWNSNLDFVAARYNTNGSLDNTFGFGGVISTNVGSSDDVGSSVVIQPDGKILVSGFSGTIYNYALVRYNTDGSLDNTFDVDGKLETSVSTYEDWGRSVALQSDGKIVLAGWGQIPTDYDFALARFNSNGSLDLSFDTDGVVGTDFFGVFKDDRGYSMAIQPDGKIVVAGMADNGSNNYIAVARYNPSSTGIDSYEESGSGLSIFPNPFSVRTTLQTSTQLNNATISVNNCFGQVVRQMSGINGQTVVLDREGLANGIYSVRIVQDNLPVAFSKFVVLDK